MAGAETFALISGRRTEVDCRSVVGRFSGEKESYVCSEIAKAGARHRLRILPLDCSWRADEKIRNAQVDTEAMRKVVARSCTQVKNFAVAAGASFKARPQRPAGIKSRAVLARRSIGGRIWSLGRVRTAK